MSKPDVDPDLCGIINVRKPAGCTSRDIVNQIQRLLGRGIKVGHAGTLDPMATGVLLVCVGRATRLIPLVHHLSKTYMAGFTLGQTSDTDDSTGCVESKQVDAVPDLPTVRQAVKNQIGNFQQTPPVYSAVKVQGKRAYAQARKGKSVQLRARPVTVHSIEILEYEFPSLMLRIHCASGTYIRSIARDLGIGLGTGGLMHSLDRIDIGPFKSETAVSADAFQPSDVRPIESIFAAGFNLLQLNANQIQRLRIGQRLTIDSNQPNLIAVTDQGQFAASLVPCSKKADQGNYRAEINWVPAWFQGQ